MERERKALLGWKKTRGYIRVFVIVQAVTVCDIDLALVLPGGFTVNVFLKNIRHVNTTNDSFVLLQYLERLRDLLFVFEFLTGSFVFLFPNNDLPSILCTSNYILLSVV